MLSIALYSTFKLVYFKCGCSLLKGISNIALLEIIYTLIQNTVLIVRLYVRA